MGNSRGLIILESAMNHRFKAIAKIHDMPVFTANLQNNFNGNPVKNILVRMRQKKRLKKAIKEIGGFIEDHNLTQVFFSSAEGFVGHNIILGLRKKAASFEMIALQHGVFPLQNSWVKEIARSIFNKMAKMFFGLFPLGPGFGGIKLDEYYVYSEREKEYLVKYRGWSEKRVKVAPDFIKADLLKKFNSLEISQSSGNAIFLGQCLGLAGLCSKKMEEYYSQTIINSLARRYEKLFIKGHPSCADTFKDLDLPDNVFHVDDMLLGFAKCKTAYSFFSTALIDAKIFNLKTVGIFVEQLKVEAEIYKNFDLKLKFEEVVSI